MNAQPEVLVHALQRFSPDPEAVYSIDAAAHLSGMPRHLILVSCKHGLVAPLVDPDYGGYYFDHATIRVMKRINYLYSDCGINVAGIRIILGLMEEVERLRAGERVS
jgi:DNA-binding transcriptional MerR regulator